MPLHAFLEVLHESRRLAVRLIVSLFVVFISGGMSGVGLVLHSMSSVPHAKSTPHLFLSVAPQPRMLQNQDVALATDDLRITANTAAIAGLVADNRLLHDEIARAREVAKEEYNKVTDRVNVDEARMSTILWVGGFLFGLVNLIPISIAIFDFRFKRKNLQTGSF